MNRGGVSSDQLCSDIQPIWASGQAVKASTNSSAGAR
jgi:hypothetical protein